MSLFQMNTYFGASVAAIDLNNDGLSDLLIGAPLYTEKMDEGRVYVYINHGEVWNMRASSYIHTYIQHHL